MTAVYGGSLRTLGSPVRLVHHPRPQSLLRFSNSKWGKADVKDVPLRLCPLWSEAKFKSSLLCGRPVL